LAVPCFQATVTVEPAERLEIVPTDDDQPRWDSVGHLVERVDREGYGTGPQLLAAAIRTFSDVAASVEYRGFDRLAFRVGYETTIPRQVGLAGSSALVVATLRALSEVTGLELPNHVLPSIALRVETDQLGITAGLQDRVVQTYGGLVSMNFAEMTTDARFGVAHGEYRHLESADLPPLFLAYRTSAAEPSDDYHRVLRQRYESGDGAVRETLRSLAALVVEGEAALRWGDGGRLAGLIERNMMLRSSLGPIPESQLDLVEVARSCDAAATFAGSGGAVVGHYTDDEHLARIEAAMAGIDAQVVAIEL
jgi:glucuronokinase